MERKIISVLGATGTVGMQALDVARSRGYGVDLITANKSVGQTEALVREFSPRLVAMADEASARDLAVRLKDTTVKVLSGEDGICEAIGGSRCDTVVNAILGKAGLMPTVAAVKTGKRLALSNKESLVIAGGEVKALARLSGCEIIPVDSEHSAIFQSLHAGKREEVKRLILTASGGPFFGKTKEELERVTLEDTLAHPTWKMGRKITVDSATLMNKGFEIIEAAHLFDIPAEKIQVVVHRESILHSAVEYIDNTVIGELSVPDMRMCVQYAVDYPDRFPTASGELDLFSIGALTFMRPDTKAFPLLPLAVRAMQLGGAMPAVLNAADEVAVAAFLEGTISFTQISDTVISTFDALTGLSSVTGIDGLIEADKEARSTAEKIIKGVIA